MEIAFDFSPAQEEHIKTIRAKNQHITPLNKRVATSLREMIVAGVFPPKTRITEEMVASILGVSRTPTRDALATLTNEGILEYARTGLFVRKWTLEDYVSIYQIVMQLEALAAQCAALRGLSLSEEMNINVILSNLEKAKSECAAGNTQPEIYNYIAEYNYEFHMAIAKCSGNEWLPPILQTLLEKLLLLRPTLANSAYTPSFMDDHLLIFQAILSNDAQKASELATKHIQRSIDQIVNP